MKWYPKVSRAAKKNGGKSDAGEDDDVAGREKMDEEFGQEQEGALSETNAEKS